HVCKHEHRSSVCRRENRGTSHDGDRTAERHSLRRHAGTRAFAATEDRKGPELGRLNGRGSGVRGRGSAKVLLGPRSTKFDSCGTGCGWTTVHFRWLSCIRATSLLVACQLATKNLKLSDMAISLSLEGKVALITGGSRGIGAATVRAFV